MTQPIKLRSTNENFMLYADKPNNWQPTLMRWPLSQNVSHRLEKQTHSNQQFDFIASFLKMKVPRGQTYVLHSRGLRPRSLTSMRPKWVEVAEASLRQGVLALALAVCSNIRGHRLKAE